MNIWLLHNSNTSVFWLIFEPSLIGFLHTLSVPAAGCNIPQQTAPQTHLRASASECHVVSAEPVDSAHSPSEWGCPADEARSRLMICYQNRRSPRLLAGPSDCFTLMFPHRTEPLPASSAVMHISADSRPPVRPPCPLFPCSTPSELSAFTQSHALSWDELQQHGGHADLVQGTVFFLLHCSLHTCSTIIFILLSRLIYLRASRGGLSGPRKIWLLSWLLRKAVSLKAHNSGILHVGTRTCYVRPHHF